MNIMEKLLQKIENILQDSDKILIGLGEEFTSDKIQLSNSTIYNNYLEKRTNEKGSDEVEWLIEYIRNYYINNEVDLEQLNIFQAYKELFRMVKDKDYYIISLNTDGLLEKVGFSSDRIVHPCGFRNNFQCANNCSNEVWQNVDIENNIIQKILDKNIKLSQIKTPICEKCGELAQYNVIEKSNYSENGYLDKWSNYLEWTALTLNKKICVLELGVSFKYPSVIRWPFEKISFFNNKAQFIRVNEKFEQVSEELANKAITIKVNSIDFLLK